MDKQEALDHLRRTYFGPDPAEGESLRALPGILDGCELFIDVGASLGVYTYHANQAMQQGSIVAIEADPDRFEELERSCGEWSSESTNEIRPVHAAVGDADEPIEFFTTGTQVSGGFFPVPERSHLYQAIQVPQLQLDSLYEEGRRTVVKVDVEGGELRVLQGASRHIAGGSHFLIEMHWWGDRERGDTVLDLLRFLWRHRIHVHKVNRSRTSSYLLTPAGGRRVWPGYLRVVPLQVVRYAYGSVVPAPVRRLRERALLALRRRRRRVRP